MNNTANYPGSGAKCFEDIALLLNTLPDIDPRRKNHDPNLKKAAQTLKAKSAD